MKGRKPYRASVSTPSGSSSAKIISAGKWQVIQYELFSSGGLSQIDVPPARDSDYVCRDIKVTFLLPLSRPRDGVSLPSSSEHSPTECCDSVTWAAPGFSFPLVIGLKPGPACEGPASWGWLRIQPSRLALVDAGFGHTKC